ncbi:toxin-antitoxin system HicB family antitoxin [Streptomyces sp. NPDC058321]|uniref:plasmid mobilization protein n=1 Tax=Streptomyces sp. NPDC058321 TaxID=3346445 RepID=UPI0036E472FD
MAAKKQINVRVDQDVYDGIVERAAAAGMDVNEYARQVLADESNDLRHRFLDAAEHWSREWAPHFAEEFGEKAPTAGPGQAAA